MPINNITGTWGLSSTWTYQAIASEVMVLTNTADNEFVQLSNVRTHVNLAISYIVNLLNLAEAPWYNIFITATLENTLHPTGLAWVNLNQPVQIQTLNNLTITINPARDIQQIKRVSIVPRIQLTNQQVSQRIQAVRATTTVLPGATLFNGNVIKKDLSELVQLNTAQNTQWYHSVVWTHSGRDLLLMIGNEIVDQIYTPLVPFKPIPRAAYFIDTTNNTGSQFLTITATRKPILDDLLSPETSQTFTLNVDVPDEYVDLVVKIGQKRVLEQLNQIVPAQLEAEINQGLAQITQQLQADLQFESAEREKRRYGQQQRPPGAV